MIELFFTISGVLLLSYLIVILFVAIFKAGVISVFTGFFVGIFGFFQSFLLLNKWWAVALQLPFLALYVLFVYYESWSAIPYIVLFQIPLGFLFHGINEMTTKSR